MQITGVPQLYTFVASICLGAALGVFYDFFRFLRTIGFNSKVQVFIEDLVFSLVLTVVVFLFSIGYNSGETRFFTLMGHLMGFLAFRFTIGRVTIKIYSIIAKVFLVAFRLISNFFKKIYTNISSRYKVYEEKKEKKPKKTEKKSKKSLKDKKRLVYNKRE